MKSLTLDGLKAKIESAAPITEIVDEATVRAELAAWLERYFGVGKVGAIHPAVTDYRTDDDYDVTYDNVCADVDGLPLHPTQYLELEREVFDNGVVFRAVLSKTIDGLPREYSDGSEGEFVYCLADLAGKLI